MRRLLITLLAASIAPITWCGVTHALGVPILVQELLPQGVPSHSRSPDLVTVGVPLAPEDGIHSIEELGFSGAPAAQFRVLQRNPETNQICWVQASDC